ncbi:MAG: ABC transporter ATP-binding protein [Candidatus Vecturithrix sp.]|jgi:peptide/nickel transport system ATP-binding protein/oligopeptide transport system ATP-binding protein|nr:ABC transporter ATP-binding protein [Candidatus Vecturithrix sp.]
MNAHTHLLELHDVHTYFYTFDGVAKAVDGVSFYLDRGEVLGIVGESGCGKSVTAQSIMKLIPQPPRKIVQGEILFDGQNLVNFSLQQMRRIRGNRIAMIFQEPMTSLNPVYTIGDQIAEMIALHQKVGKRESWNRAIEMLKKVQIPVPEKRISEYPHQLSGGMRQRAMIAMAMSCNPEILIADEPTTALDVTVQAQILELMLQLREDFEAAIMMITHDLGVIAEMASRVVVMYAGNVVEHAHTIPLFQEPKHPYTEGLLQSIPQLGDRSERGRARLDEIKGTVPSLYNLPAGCRFAPRCKYRMAICEQQMPELHNLGNDHHVRCWKYE